MGLWIILYMLWKNINRYIHLKDKLVLSFKFKHGNGNTPNRKECQRIQNKTIQHVLREGNMEKIRHLQMIPENNTNFLWMELQLHVHAGEKQK